MAILWPIFTYSSTLFAGLVMGALEGRNQQIAESNAAQRQANEVNEAGLRAVANFTDLNHAHETELEFYRRHAEEFYVTLRDQTNTSQTLAGDLLNKVSDLEKQLAASENAVLKLTQENKALKATVQDLTTTTRNTNHSADRLAAIGKYLADQGPKMEQANARYENSTAAQTALLNRKKEIVDGADADIQQLREVNSALASTCQTLSRGLSSFSSDPKNTRILGNIQTKV